MERNGTAALAPLGTQDHDDMIRFVSILTEARATLAACIAILIWEWLTQFSLEYQHIWRAPFKHTTVAFIILRYFTFVSFALNLWLYSWSGSDETCQRMIYCLWLLPIIVHLLAQYLVIARMYALHDSNKLVLILLSTLTVVQAGLQAWLTSRLEAATWDPHPLISVCICKGYEDYWLFWILPFVFDTVVLVLALTKLFGLWQNDGKNCRLVHLMIRDQVAWYALTALLSAVNLIVCYTSPAAPDAKGKGTVSFILTAVTSMSVCRVILNLRKSVASDSTKSFSSLFIRDKSSNIVSRNTPTLSAIGIGFNTCTGSGTGAGFGIGLEGLDRRRSEEKANAVDSVPVGLTFACHDIKCPNPSIQMQNFRSRSMDYLDRVVVEQEEEEKEDKWSGARMRRPSVVSL